MFGMIRDGITTWAPVYYNESFAMTQTTAVLLTAMLPASKILAYVLNPILSKHIPNMRKMLCTAYLRTWYHTGITYGAFEWPRCSCGNHDGAVVAYQW